MSALRNNLNPKRLAVNVIEDAAKSEPDRVFAKVPISKTGFHEGVQSVTYGALANAINGIAWYLKETIGVTKEFETLAYIGPNDLSHALLLLGAVKAGFKMMFTSPRYSPVAQAKLLELADCNKLLVSEDDVSRQVVDAIAVELGATSKVFQIPNIQRFLDSKHEEFPYSKTFEQAMNEPLVVLHTSGTTGFPKPLIWTHGWASSFAYQLNLQPPEGFESNDTFMVGNTMFSLVPAFHASGLFASLIFPIWCNSTVILPPTGIPPSISVAVEASKHIKYDIIACVPPYIEQLAADPSLMDILNQNGSPHMFFAGGVVSYKAGDMISSKMSLTETSGSTEMGAWPVLRKGVDLDPTDWAGLSVHPASGIQFRPVIEDLYAAVIVKNKSDDPSEIQPVFHIFPDLQEFDTRDLFRRDTRPGKEHIWYFHGRSDDLQAHITGEKLHPVVVEQLIKNSCDMVQEVLFVLTGFPRASLLIEGKPGALAQDDSKDQMLEEVWKAAQLANERLPLFAKIAKEYIIILGKDHLLPRTAKGSIQRKQAAEVFGDEIRNRLQGVDAITYTRVV